MPRPTHFELRDLQRARSAGRRVFRSAPLTSLWLGATFDLIGAGMLAALVPLGASPHGWILAGGFLLIGPAFRAGFFAR